MYIVSKADKTEVKAPRAVIQNVAIASAANDDERGKTPDLFDP
ncbi:hypothetical protein [Caballeronia sordidicola]|nr:hypothetical protein [Caballeronia sordidicola]